jgi:hypothetical protein
MLKTRKINLVTVDECYKRGSVDVYTYFARIFVTSGYLPRVRARTLRTPVFLGSLTRKTGRWAPRLAHRSSADPADEINDI